jgi:hypothetical protein
MGVLRVDSVVSMVPAGEAVVKNIGDAARTDGYRRIGLRCG